MTITNDGNGNYFNGNWFLGAGQVEYWQASSNQQFTNSSLANVGDFMEANRLAQGRNEGLGLKLITTGGWLEYTPVGDPLLNGTIIAFASDLDSNADKGNQSRLAMWLNSNATDEQRIVWHTATSEVGILTSSVSGSVYNFNFFNSTRRNWSVHTDRSIGMFQKDNSGVVTNWAWFGLTVDSGVSGDEAFVAIGNTDESDVNWGRAPNGGGNLYGIHVATGTSVSDYTVVAANGGNPSGTYVSDLYVKWSTGPSSGQLLGRCQNMFYGVGSFTVGDVYEIVPATSLDEPDPSGLYFGASRPIYATCISTWGDGTYILMRIGDTQ